MITQDPDELEYALIVLWELLEQQAPLLEGREADIFAALLRVRYSANLSVRHHPVQFPICAHHAINAYR